MVGVLSIDFDYFIDVTAKERLYISRKETTKYQRKCLRKCGRRYLKYPVKGGRPYRRVL